jgi:hypothetical protein
MDLRLLATSNQSSRQIGWPLPAGHRPTKRLVDRSLSSQTHRIRRQTLRSGCSISSCSLPTLGQRLRSAFEKASTGITSRVRAELTELRNIKPIRVPVLLVTAGDVLTSAIAPLIGVVGQLGAGVFAMGTQVASATASVLAFAGAAGRSVGVLGTLPTFLTAAGLAAGSFRLALTGMDKDRLVRS